MSRGYRELSFVSVFCIVLLILAIASTAGAGNLKKEFREHTSDAMCPGITCPPDVTIDCSESKDPLNTGRPTVTGGRPPYDITYYDAVTDVVCPYGYVINRTWTARDDGGYAVDCIQRITVEDKTPPVINCPSKKVFECDDIGDFGSPTVTDNCDPEPEVTYKDSVIFQRCDNEYTILRTYTATDVCGNSASCSHRIIILDTKPPVITYCPSDTVLSCDAKLSNLPHITVTDNCNPEPDVTYENVVIPGTCPHERTILRSWEVTDHCCNTVACQQVITIEDKEAPVLTCGADARVEWNELVEFTAPGATDNCDPDPDVIMVGDFSEPGPAAGEMTHRRCWVAKDACGNQSDVGCQTIIVAAPPLPFCTFTSNEWGLPCPRDGNCGPRNGNPACLLEDYFDVVFPNGVMIGDDTGPGMHYALWTSADAVEDFLPSPGNLGVLTEDLIDPERTPAGFLADAILSLRLNCEFSCSGTFATASAFTRLSDCFSDFVIPDSCGSRFAGMTVGEFLELADQVVGGNTAVLEPYSAGLVHVNFTAACLNWSYRGCGWCNCPEVTGGSADDEADEIEEAVETQVPAEFKVSCHPNPLKGSTTVSLSLPAACHVSVEIYDILGRRVVGLLNGHAPAGQLSPVWKGTDMDGNQVTPGVYFCRVKADGHPALMEKLIKM
jgi:hypothetical protein